MTFLKPQIKKKMPQHIYNNLIKSNLKCKKIGPFFGIFYVQNENFKLMQSIEQITYLSLDKGNIYYIKKLAHSNSTHL